MPVFPSNCDVDVSCPQATIPFGSASRISERSLPPTERELKDPAGAWTPAAETVESPTVIRFSPDGPIRTSSVSFPSASTPYTTSPVESISSRCPEAAVRKSPEVTMSAARSRITAASICAPVVLRFWM